MREFGRGASGRVVETPEALVERVARGVTHAELLLCATEHVKLGGRRRGANMAVLRVDHPDILEFVEAKRDGTSLSNFNLSVAVPDRFMAAVRSDAPYDLVHSGRRRVARTLPARMVFERIVEAAWATGDPGLLFVDAVNRASPVPALGPIEATNPCGEVPLLPYESCVLGSVNLANMVRTVGDEAEIGDATRRTRKVGLGVMGFAECLVALGVPSRLRNATRFGVEGAPGVDARRRPRR